MHPRRVTRTAFMQLAPLMCTTHSHQNHTDQKKQQYHDSSSCRYFSHTRTLTLQLKNYGLVRDLREEGPKYIYNQTSRNKYTAAK